MITAGENEDPACDAIKRGRDKEMQNVNLKDPKQPQD